MHQRQYAKKPIYNLNTLSTSAQTYSEFECDSYAFPNHTYLNTAQFPRWSVFLYFLAFL